MGFVCLFFFCKQKTTYEMRMSDWSSDVCSSDLSAQGEAVANVAAARAALEAAQIELGFTRIVAPIGGRIGRSASTPGAVVTTGQAAPLATIQTLDPLNVDVARSSAALFKLKQAFATGAAQKAPEAPVRLTLHDDSIYSLPLH